jgi:hypothetical protein
MNSFQTPEYKAKNKFPFNGFSHLRRYLRLGAKTGHCHFHVNPLVLTELLGFWTFPSSGILENRKHDVSESGSVSVLR